ncbi:hypothetical protein [Streptomyces celluloflavus]|uniref:hypothetical protein n=1 Tax=Streptomyces celluloflavus TaxID=58344 RepID=UPI0036C2E730
MADERYSWLDRDAAERLLRGEPVGAQDGAGARELTELLAAAAAAGAGPAATTALPGEEAALAAFRRAQVGVGDQARVPAGQDPAGHTVHTLDTVRTLGIVERIRFGRPFRRGFAAALLVCAVGGVAVAAGTGVLPTPFRSDDAGPGPAASISAAVTPGPLETQLPGVGPDGVTPHPPQLTPGRDASQTPGTPTPGISPGGSPAPDRTTPGGGPGSTGDAEFGGGRDTTGATGGDKEPGSGHGARKKFVPALCHAYESDRRSSMDPGTLRLLERTAGGQAKVHAFCRQYLAHHGGRPGGGKGGQGQDGDGKGGNGQGGDGKGGKGDNGQGGDEGDDEDHPAPPSPAPSPGASTPAPAPVTPSAPAR